MSPELAIIAPAVCAVLVAAINAAGQVLLARRVQNVHKLVNGMSARRARRARAEGAAAQKLADHPKIAP